MTEEMPTLRSCKAKARHMEGVTGQGLWLRYADAIGLLPPANDLREDQRAREAALQRAPGELTDAIDRLVAPWVKGAQ